MVEEHSGNSWLLHMAFSSHQARKRFGQHWLVDQTVLDRIVAAAQLMAGESILEIGPGRGALTSRLLASEISRLEAIELDRDLVEGLRMNFGADPRFELHSGDVLQLPLPRANKVVANIPYNITGPLLERLLGRLDQPPAVAYEQLVLLVQQEVAQRISATPGDSNYSGLSVRLQLLCECSCVCAVPSRCFQPPPKVMSAVISLRPRAEKLDGAVAQQVERLLRQSFASRRKMLRNSLATFVEAEKFNSWLEAAAVRPDQRPQELCPDQWLALASSLLPLN
jgi:16S rRNA (adenine1518-N6/adenine1519-N6)-dimethyltransferase